LFTEEEEDDGDIYILDGTIAIIFVIVGRREAKNCGFLLPCNKKELSFVKSFVEKEKNKGKEKLEKKKLNLKKKKLNFYSKLLSFKILFLFFLK
jgi:DNA-directed RNA polymerase alpha subunit